MFSQLERTIRGFKASDCNFKEWWCTDKMSAGIDNKVGGQGSGETGHNADCCPKPSTHTFQKEKITIHDEKIINSMKTLFLVKS